MKNRNGYWQPPNLEKMWREWLAPLEYGEPVIVMSYPGSDFERRLNQLIESDLEGKRKWLIKNYLKEKWDKLDICESGCETVIVILGFEQILKEKRVDLILQIRDAYRNAQTNILMLCEMNYYDSENEQIIMSLPTFEPRIVTLPMYGQAEVIHFIEYLASKWQVKLSREVTLEIVERAGTNLRFVKPLVWYLRDHGVDKLMEALESSELLWQVKSVWSQFGDLEKQCLKYLAFDLPVLELPVMSLDYLMKMRVVCDGRIESKLLCDYIQKFEKNPKLIELDGDRLVIAGNDYAKYFTGNQKTILQKLLAGPGVTISREELMQSIGVDSDWALDSHLSRLRVRLEEVGVGKKKLVTKRGRGVLWRG